MTYGVLPTGFKRKDFDTIFNELVNVFKNILGNELKITGDSRAGNIIGALSDRENKIWQQLEAVFLSGFTQFAEGEALDYAAFRIGIARYLAQYSNVTLTLTNSSLSPLTIPSGSLFKQSGINVIWEIISDVTIPADDTINVDARSKEKGAFTAEPDSIDTLVTIISGLSAVTNDNDAVVGRVKETDTELRKRCIESLVISLGGIGEAIKNRLENEVSGVTHVSWTENRTDDTDINGLVPHSFRFVVVGGDDTAVAQKISEAKPLGIPTNGATSITITDVNGNTEVIKYDRATAVNIYLEVNKTTNSKYPSNGDLLIKNLLVEYGKKLIEDDNVINHYLVGALNSIPGIDSLDILQGTSTNPTLKTTISISSNERANIQASNIVVN